MGQHVANIDFATIVVDRDDQSILVTTDVKYGLPVNLIR
jgi:hypothetical protein